MILMEPKQVARIIEAFQVIKGAPNPVAVKLMGDDDELPLLQDQTDCMLKTIC